MVLHRDQLIFVGTGMSSFGTKAYVALGGEVSFTPRTFRNFCKTWVVGMALPDS